MHNLTAASLLQNTIQPAETLVKTFTSGGGGRLDVPRTLAAVSQAEFFDNFTSAHGLRQVLFVGEDEEDGITQFVFVEHSVELVASNGNTITIVAIDYKDDSLRVVVVVAPEGANAVLTTNVPDSEGG